MHNITKDLLPLAKDITAFTPDPTNARSHNDKSYEVIANSLRQFQQRKPIVAQEKNGQLIVRAGNGTLEAAKRLGWTEIAAVIVNEDSVVATAYALADNKTAEISDWDDSILSKQLSSLMDEGVDMEDFGFDIDDFDLPGKAGLTGDDDIPEVSENKFNVKLGDIWQLGNHRLMCGDSTVKENVEKLMDGKKTDMVFTDPPYGISYDDATRAKWTSSQTATRTTKRNNFGIIKNDDIEVSVFTKSILNFFDYCERIFIWGVLNGKIELPVGGSFIVWDRKNEAQEDCPFGDFDICWSKNVGWKMIRVMWGGFVSKEKGEQRWHPTQKPIALVEQFFSNWGKPDDLVTDLFLGSGSTLIACEKTNRKCYGSELDPHYCSVIIQRWQDFTGKEAIKIQ